MHSAVIPFKEVLIMYNFIFLSEIFWERIVEVCAFVQLAFFIHKL